MIWFDVGDARFGFRSAGVCIEDGHVLINTVSGMDVWFLPGGRVELGETSEEALHRELAEELGVSIEVGRLLWMVESLFQLEGRLFQEVGLYYAFQLSIGSPYGDKAAVYSRPHEGGEIALFRWLRLEEIHAANLVPPFLKTSLLSLPEHPQRIVERR